MTVRLLIRSKEAEGSVYKMKHSAIGEGYEFSMLRHYIYKEKTIGRHWHFLLKYNYFNKKGYAINLVLRHIFSFPVN